jgi:hypothetical protein
MLGTIIMLTSYGARCTIRYVMHMVGRFITIGIRFSDVSDTSVEFRSLSRFDSAL